jgi:cardiolipin synthase
VRLPRSVVVTLAISASALVLTGADDEGLPVPKRLGGAPAPAVEPVQELETDSDLANLAGMYRIQGRDEQLGFYTGRLQLQAQPDGTYTYERRLELTSHAQRVVPASLQRERGKAWLLGGRLWTRQVVPVDANGLLQGMNQSSLRTTSNPLRRGVYLARLGGRSFQGLSKVSDGSLRGVERLDRVPEGHDNRVDLLVDGAEVFPLLRSELAAATRSISIQTFIYTDDSTGRAIGRILMEKARAGIPVRVLVDASGDRMGDEFEEELRAAGVELIIQHQLIKGLGNSIKGVGKGIWGFFKRLFGGKKPAPRERRGLFNHDHRKITVVDGKVGFIGGMNIGREYETEWHDVHTRVRGSAVRELEELFYDRWRAAGGKAETPPPAAELACSDGYLQVDVVASLPGVSTAIKERYLSEIRGAQHRVLIEMAYFLDTDIIDALQDAERRGVRALVILPPDEGHDVPIVRDAFNHVQNDFVRSGIELYKFKDQFVHAKVATFDGKVATVGSSNLDGIALTKLAEANIFVPDRGFARELDERIFARDVPRSRRVKVRKLSWWQKIKGFSLHMIRGVL